MSELNTRNTIVDKSTVDDWHLHDATFVRLHGLPDDLITPRHLLKDWMDWISFDDKEMERAFEYLGDANNSLGSTKPIHKKMISAYLENYEKEYRSYLKSISRTGTRIGRVPFSISAMEKLNRPDDHVSLI